MSDGKHWRQAEVHFEWRQRVLDETLAMLDTALRKAVHPKEIAVLSTALTQWSKAQGELDKDAKIFKPVYPEGE